MRRSKLLVTAGGLVLALATPGTVFAGPGNTVPDGVQVASAEAVKEQFKSAPRDNSGRVSAIIELREDPVAVVETKSGRSLAQPDKEAVKTRLKEAQGTVSDAVRAKGGIVRAQMQSAYNGVQVVVTPEELAEVVKLPKVKAVHPVVMHEPSNSSAIPYLGVDQVWANTGYTGKNVKVAIIDSGIDYTHADFRGPGTVAAYNDAKSKATAVPDPALFGPNAPRIKGGWDLVGDEYDGPFTPWRQDPNPLDCRGHGTHVAGSLGGSGVLADGSGYSGPYDESVSEKSWEVGPGVAPEADLYVLKVFGCYGGTDTGAVVKAIDLAVEHGMQVINMSLGSSFGTSYDASAVAATNAAAAGVVVVAAAGNSGNSPHAIGSPASGNGVVSVAATDTRRSLPGAYLQFPDKRIEAININNKDLSSMSKRLRVAVLNDEPSTTADESYGCSVWAYKRAWIRPHMRVKQLAVVKEGGCDGNEKARLAWRAGAVGVIMISRNDELPMYEAIDSGAVPLFLGVKSSDGASVKSAEGQDLTLKKFEITNRDYSGYASFSSAGPRGEDAALKPSVTAPGAAIRSAGLGTGNKGTVKSGTSMATPMVAGVAALGIQSHPDWDGKDVAAMLVNTADPSKIVGFRATRGGGLIDPAGAVAAKSVVFGDSYNTPNGNVREGTLSFGFGDTASRFNKSKAITVVNKGASPVQYTISVDRSVSSVDASVSVSRKRITIPAGQSRDIWVNMIVEAKDLPAGMNQNADRDKGPISEVSGHIRIVQDGGATLRVPYLMVPRSKTGVAVNQELVPTAGR